MRTVADTSADAEPSTPVAVYDSYLPGGQPGWLLVGGTSAAAPLIAGVYALAGNTTQAASPAYLYGHTHSLYDVTSGSNGTCGKSNYLCNAKRGYDGPTGWGTPDALDYPGKFQDLWDAAEAGEDCRIATAVPIKLFIADDRMALAPLHQPEDVESAIIMHPSALLDALGSLFESVWQRSLPLAAFKSGTGAAAAGLSGEQRRLLQLLAAGFTDEAIARKLDRGHRTVQRHIGTLMELLSAQTRFQLGLRAAALLSAEDR